MRNKISLSPSIKHLLFFGYQHSSTPELFEILACGLSNSVILIVGMGASALRVLETAKEVLLKSLLIMGEITPFHRCESDGQEYPVLLQRSYTKAHSRSRSPPSHFKEENENIFLCSLV